MSKVKIKDLQEGMIVALAVKDKNGMLIVSQGQKITDKYIRTFKTWGITEIDIEKTVENHGDKDCLAEKKVVIVSAEVKEKVDDLFRYTDKQHPAMVELMELCILRKTESL